MPLRPGLRARSLGAWVLAAGLAISGQVGALAVSGDAGQSAVSGRAVPAANDEAADRPAPDAQLVLAPSEPVIEVGADEVQFSVLLRNTGDADLPAGTVSLELGSRPVTDDDEWSAQSEEPRGAGADPLPGTALPVATAELGATAAGEEQALTVTVARRDLPLDLGAVAGAYVVRATVTFGSDADAGADAAADAAADASRPGDLVTTSPLVWKGAGMQSVPASVIVPFVLPSDIHTLPTRPQLEELAPRWDRLLTAARKAEATLAIDPRVVIGIRAYGEEAPAAAREVLERLETTTLPSFLLQFADADPSAQAALGFTTLLGPTSVDFITRFGSWPADGGTSTGGSNVGADQDSEADAGERAADSATHASGGGTDQSAETDDSSEPTETPGDAPANAPDLEELSAWPAESAPTAWPAGGRADAATIDLLDTANIDRLVLSSDGVTLAGGPRAKLGEDRATVTDAALSDASRVALSAASETERASGLADLAARLVVDAQSESRGVVIGLDRGAVADSADPAALLDELADFAWAEPTAIDDQRAGKATLQPSGTSEQRLELLRAASNREGSVAEVGAVLVHPEYLGGYQRTRLLELFATRYAEDEARFADVAASFRARDAELLGGVQALSTEHIQLVGSSTRVPVQVRNALPFDALVTVEVQPASAALAISERTFPQLLVPAEANEAVMVPVHTRVSSGESGLVIGVTAADGVHTVFTGTLPITIRSGVETVAFWVLGGLAVALLGFGIVRSVHRRRRLRAAGRLAH
ncbi:DUF6049 family protein [Leucobacter sp. USHLN153]|uniref:DUF6049 family protein n=1 Tax=Leucobacter sp. USHLN153 TaxID=3081268 RepID=UPI003017B8A3